MAPTICCREVTNKFHRRRVKHPHQLPMAAAPAPGHGEHHEDGADLGGTYAMTAATVCVAEEPRAPRAKRKLFRKMAALHRRRRPHECEGVAAAWHPCGGAPEDYGSVFTTTADGGGAGKRPWEWCGGAEGGVEMRLSGRGAEDGNGCPQGGAAPSKRGPRNGVGGRLLGITVRTVELMRRNQMLQWRLSLLQEETRAFVKSVLSNPENRRGVEGRDPGETQDPAISGSC